VSQTPIEHNPASADQRASTLKSKVQSLRLPIEQKQPSRSRLAWFFVLLLLLLNGATGYWAFQLQKAVKNAAAAKPATTAVTPATPTTGTPPPGEPVESTSTPAPGRIALESRGFIMPTKQILVSPKVSGMIVELDIEEGKRVTKGDVLAVIESTEYQSEFDRQTALLAAAKQRLLELERGSRPEEVSQAEADLAQAETQLDEDERQYKRQQLLAKQNAGTESALTQAETQFVAQQKRVERARLALTLLRQGAREERVEIARAEVKQVEADLARATWRLGNCTIHAPISGTILRKNAEEGNIVNSVAFNGSYSICEMADLANLEVDLKILESDIRKIRVGQKCTITTEAWPGRVYEGHVDRLLPIADRAQGAIPTRVKVKVPADEEGIYLKPEMSAVVTFYEGDPPAEKPLAKTGEF
jgi:HlyD family secretion protein